MVKMNELSAMLVGWVSGFLLGLSGNGERKEKAEKP